MRGIERRLAIIKQLQAEGRADVTELADRYDVSTMTIRRDLTKLQEDGLVTVEYGGVILNNGSMLEYNTAMKECIRQDEKVRIAKACESYIKDGDSIFMDAGTTVNELAKLLVNRKKLTVMTHSLLVANTLASSDLTVIMCPGIFRLTSMAYMGQLTDQFLSSFHIDKLFLGVEGVDLEQGVSVPDIRDGITKQNLIRRADWTVCMTDSSKFGKSYYYNISELSQLDLVVTDTGLSETEAERYRKRVSLIQV